MHDLEYIRRRQKQLEKKRKRAAELEAGKEAVRVAEMKAEAREQEKIVARKKLLKEQQEDERLHQRHVKRKQKQSQQKWDERLDILLSQIKERGRKNDRLEEIRIIIQNREPSLQQLDWDSWISNPLNQKLADLDLEHALEMFKRDNLLAKRRKKTRGHGRSRSNYALIFTGDTPGNTGTYPLAVGNYDHVTTTFDPDDYNLNEGFTVSYWVRPDELGSTMFALGRKPSTSQRFQFGINTDVNFFVGAGKLRTRTTAHGMEVGTWYHWAVTYAGNSSGRTLKVYRDATLLQEATAQWSGTGAGPGGEVVYFGGYNIPDDSGGDEYTAGWACGLDQVAIFNTAKDAGWVASVYNTGQKKLNLTNESGLVGYWKFNEGSGTTITDHSGNGNHGTFAAISGDTTAYPTWEKI